MKINSIYTLANKRKIKIIKYINAKNILIEFCDKTKYRKITTAQCISSLTIKNPYIPQIFNKGYIGSMYDITKHFCKMREYKIWVAMLRRCYDKKYHKRKPTYKNCTVCKEWHNFSNFYNWIIKQENYSKLISAKLQLDKDILVKGNKIYSPRTCCLVPSYINSILTKRQNDRGDCLIKKKKNIRRYNNKKHITYMMRVQIDKKQYEQNFKTEIEAFRRYKELKEKEIKKVAEGEYKKGNITKKCYAKLLKYKIVKSDQENEMELTQEQKDFLDEVCRKRAEDDLKALMEAEPEDLM